MIHKPPTMNYFLSITFYCWSHISFFIAVLYMSTTLSYWKLKRNQPQTSCHFLRTLLMRLVIVSLCRVWVIWESKTWGESEMIPSAIDYRSR